MRWFLLSVFGGFSRSILLKGKVAAPHRGVSSNPFAPTVSEATVQCGGFCYQSLVVSGLQSN
ncbi:MAG: hypothetical protein LDL12_03670, partial [Anaerolinea sp.]|nr:hypothetical protein [Anaerolinea sp.]